MSALAFVAKLAAMPRPFSSNRFSNLRRSTAVRQPAPRPEVTRLLCFHKPYGVLSQFTPEGKWQGLKDWIDVPGVYVAGRLDADSEGLLLLTNDGTLIMLGARYLRISSLSYLFIGLSQMYLCLMKNTGSAVMGMTVSTVGVIVHVVLNAALIYGIGSLGIPALGIFGAAISTVISRAIELAWSVVATRRGPHLRLGHVLHPDGPLQKDFWKYSLPVLGNELVWGCGFTMYTVIMGHLGADAVAANSIANIVKDLLVCLSLGLGNAGGILVGNLLGRGDFRQAKAMGDRMCVLVAVVGTATGLLIVAARPLALQWANLTPEATRYLSVMLFVCAYYAACGCMTNLTIAGIFPAGGDAKFGLMCDAIVMWLIVVPVGLLAAFVFKLPVLVVYALLNTDECIKMVPALLHYRKYRWLRNVTR